MKYIYFEIRKISGYGETPETIQNENILMIKPHTNSEGIWQYHIISERKGFPEISFLLISQCWVDLTKFKSSDNSDLKLKSIIDRVVANIEDKRFDMYMDELPRFMKN
jgi:hypothetical protein